MNHDSKNLMHSSDDMQAKYEAIDSTCGMAGPFIKKGMEPFEQSMHQAMTFIVMFGLGYSQIYEGIKFNGHL